MKLTNIFLIGLLLFNLNSYAQELSEEIKEVSTKITNTEKGERLKWMDSLTSLVKYDIDQKYDSIAKSTLNYAIELDSMAMVARQISDLIYHYGAYADDYESLYQLFDTHKPLVEKMIPQDRSLVYLELGDAYKFDAKNEQALTYLDSAYFYAQQANKHSISAKSKLYQSQIHASNGQYIEAFEAGRIAESYFLESNDKEQLIAIKILLGALKSQQEFFDEAEVLFKEGIELATEIEDNTSLSIIYNNLSRNLVELEAHQESIIYAKLAYETGQNSRGADFLKIRLLSALVRKYSRVDSLKIAKRYIDSMRAVGSIENFNLRDRIMAEEAMAHYYYHLGDYQEALNLWQNNQNKYVKQLGAEGQLDHEKFLADVYEKLGNSSKQAIHLKKYVTLYDSIKSAKNRQTLIYYQTKYETEKRDHKIETQEKDLSLLEQKNKVKNQWLLFGGLGLMALFGFILLIRSRNNLKAQQDRQADFSKKLLYAQEVERTRVAKDLHDSIGQKLSVMIRKSENLEQGELAVMATETLDEVRTISKGLYPPMLQKLGLSKSIRHLLREIDEETEMFVSAEIDDIDPYFNEEETSTFYRFMQESISNVIKHADAKTLMVQISLSNNQLKAIIKDNGKGFASEGQEVRNSLGLKTMSERIKLLKGKFSINSNQKSGTIITAEFNK